MHWFIRIPTAILAAMLSSCVPLEPHQLPATAVTVPQDEQTEKANPDDVDANELARAEWVICHGARAGAVKARYLEDPRLHAAWWRICFHGPAPYPDVGSLRPGAGW